MGFLGQQEPHPNHMQKCPHITPRSWALSLVPQLGETSDMVSIGQVVNTFCLWKTKAHIRWQEKWVSITLLVLVNKCFSISPSWECSETALPSPSGLRDPVILLANKLEAKVTFHWSDLPGALPLCYEIVAGWSLRGLWGTAGIERPLQTSVTLTMVEPVTNLSCWGHQDLGALCHCCVTHLGCCNERRQI